MRRRGDSADESEGTKGAVIEQLVEIGEQLEAATRALRNLVQELRADLPPEITQED